VVKDDAPGNAGTLDFWSLEITVSNPGGPTPTPIPPYDSPLTSDEHSLIWDIAPNVPEADVIDIRTGISLAGSYLSNVLGGDIPDAFRQTMTVKLVATGNGNQEPGGGGSCCTGLSDGDPNGRPFFDVFHEHWDRAQSPSPYWTLQVDKWRTAAHEYTHAWQNSLGCLYKNNQPLGDWLNEGIADYVGHHALVSAGIMNSSLISEDIKGKAKNAGQTDIPLQTFESDPPTWPGHIGYLAVDWLVNQSPVGIQSLANICTLVASGNSGDDAFEQAFGIAKADFYLISDQLGD
jgi:hypothetical protein